jgi:hypothetical protein
MYLYPQTELPTLIFEFANYKPVKSNLKQPQNENTKHSIAHIFALVNKFKFILLTQWIIREKQAGKAKKTKNSSSQKGIN